MWLASGLAKLYQNFYLFPVLRFETDATLIAAATAISATAAAIGAVTAVRGAVRLAPAVAMRPEQPPAFHRGLVERLGLQRWLSPAARIIMRNLARRRSRRRCRSSASRWRLRF
jgi:putative ABC transport system permease protein